MGMYMRYAVTSARMLVDMGVVHRLASNIIMESVVLRK